MRPEELLPYAASLAFVVAVAVYLRRVGPRLRQRPVLAAAFAISLLPALHALAVWLRLVPELYLRLLRPSLVALVPLAMAFAAARLAGAEQGRSARVRRVLGEIATSLAVLAASLAVVGLELGRPLDRLTIVVALDRSRSVDLVPEADERIARELGVAETGMRDDDRIAVVVFGASASTEQPARTKAEPATGQKIAVPRDGTDLEAALRRALAEVPADSAARIVLLSDGVATRGDVMRAAAASVAAEIPVDVVSLEQRDVPDVRLVAVRAPSRGDAGEPIDLRVVTSAPEATKVEVRVKLDGELVQRGEVDIAKGEDVLRLRQKLPDAGLHRYDVEITALDPSLDWSGEDNAASSFVRVRGEASALVLEGDPGQAGFVASSLEQASFRVEVQGPAGVPADLGTFARYDLVVLSDIAASQISPPQLEALASYVRDFGGGLLLMGGDRSMGPGGYGKTPIEEVSPVSFDLKQEQRRASLAEVIGIDISGSMGATVGDKTKLELANEAAARSAALLGPGDRLGVVHVDTAIRWSVPLGPVVDKEKIDAAIRTVQVGGGGILVPITLEAAYQALDREKVNLKHVLLFADGSDAEDMPAAKPLAAAAKSRGITTSVVALGQGGDVPALEELSRIGGGRFYLVEDATRLPAVFAQETILAARSAIVEEPFRVSLVTPGNAAMGIDFGAAPPLDGYVVTIPKARASVHLSGPESDPVLATWSVGVGRAGAFTSDLKDRWGTKWSAWPGAARMMVQTARDLSRKGEDERVRLEADTAGGQLHVRATVLGEDGRAQSFRRLIAKVGGPGGYDREIALEPSGAGVYSTNLPLERPGTYVVLARDELSGEPVGTTGAVLTAGEELRPTGSDVALLGRVADFTGGKRRDTLAGIFGDRPTRRFAYDDLSRLLVLLAGALLLASVAARRLALPEAWVDYFAKLRRRPAFAAAPAGEGKRTVEALLAAKGRAAPLPSEPGRAAPPAGTSPVTQADRTVAPSVGPAAPHAPRAAGDESSMAERLAKARASRVMGAHSIARLPEPPAQAPSGAIRAPATSTPDRPPMPAPARAPAPAPRPPAAPQGPSAPGTHKLSAAEILLQKRRGKPGG